MLITSLSVPGRHLECKARVSPLLLLLVITTFNTDGNSRTGVGRSAYSRRTLYGRVGVCHFRASEPVVTICSVGIRLF